MIDRVAAALEQCFKDRVAASAGQPFEATSVHVPGPDVWQAYARAAIEAMREPSDAMGVAMIRVALTTELYGRMTQVEDPRVLTQEEMKRIGFEDSLRANPAHWRKPDWRAAIDEALK